MKNKIIEALKNKYKHLGLGDKAIEGAATFLEPSIKEENDIETVIAGVEPLLKAFQSDTDGIRTAKTAAEKRLAELEARVKALGGAPENKDEPETKEGDEKTPEWAKTLLESNKKLTDRLNSLEGEKVTSTRKTKLDAIVAKLPENLRKPYARISVSPDMSDEDFTAMTAEITTEVEGLLTETATRGATFGRPMGGGNRSIQTTDADKPSEQETDAVATAMGLK